MEIGVLTLQANRFIAQGHHLRGRGFLSSPPHRAQQGRPCPRNRISFAALQFSGNRVHIAGLAFRRTGQGPDGEHGRVQLLNRRPTRLLKHRACVSPFEELAHEHELQAVIAGCRGGSFKQLNRRIETAQPVKEVIDNEHGLDIGGDAFGSLFKKASGFLVISGDFVCGRLQHLQEAVLRSEFVLLCGGVCKKLFAGLAGLLHLCQNEEVVFQFRGCERRDLLRIGQEFTGRFAGPFHERKYQQVVFPILRREIHGIRSEPQCLIEFTLPGEGNRFGTKRRHVFDRQKFLEWRTLWRNGENLVRKHGGFFREADGSIQVKELVLGPSMCGVQFENSRKDRHGLLQVLVVGSGDIPARLAIGKQGIHVLVHAKALQIPAHLVEGRGVVAGFSGFHAARTARQGLPVQGGMAVVDSSSHGT